MPFDGLDAELLGTFGVAGSYTPAGGSKKPAQVLIEEAANAMEGGGFDTRYQQSERVAFLLASVASDPKPGDSLTAGSAAYTVRELLNDDGLLVKLSVRTV